MPHETHAVLYTKLNLFYIHFLAVHNVYSRRGYSLYLAAAGIINDSINLVE